jgi:pimeloyl-ACP methyl ester carboxylesterase
MHTLQPQDTTIRRGPRKPARYHEVVMQPDAASDPAYRFVELTAGTVAYTDEGSGEHTVVAIPGLPGAVRDFRWLAAALGSDVRVVRVDLPGFGKSPRDGFEAMDIVARAAVVSALIDELELDAVTLVAHSSGGTVAARVANNAASRVRRCVLLASPGARPHYRMGPFRRASPLFARPLGRAVLHPLQRRLYAQLGFPRYLTDEERMYCSLDAAATDFAAHADNLRRMAQPTLVAWALDDRMIPAAIYRELEQIAPQGPRMRFSHGGHNIQKTRAVELAQAIRSHVR